MTEQEKGTGPREGMEPDRRSGGKRQRRREVMKGKRGPALLSPQDELRFWLPLLDNRALCLGG